MALLGVLLATACGGGGGGGDDDTPPLTLHCADSPMVTDTVGLGCGSTIGGDTVMIEVGIGTPTTSTDIMGFNFDIQFEPSVFSYVSGSAVAGSMLTRDGTSVLLAADVSPSDPGRLIVGIHRTGVPVGLQGLDGHGVILRLALQLKTLVVVAPSQMVFANAEAVDSQGNPILSVTFDAQLALSVQ